MTILGYIDAYFATWQPYCYVTSLEVTIFFLLIASHTKKLHHRAWSHCVKIVSLCQRSRFRDLQRAVIRAPSVRSWKRKLFFRVVSFLALLRMSITLFSQQMRWPFGSFTQLFSFLCVLILFLFLKGMLKSMWKKRVHPNVWYPSHNIYMSITTQLVRHDQNKPHGNEGITPRKNNDSLNHQKFLCEY